MRKINLGCGTNRLDGWENHDRDVDISKPLPFPTASVDFILIEHCVEHIPYYHAILFFREVRRVLKPTGVFRVTVPSVERVMRYSTPEYTKLTTKFQPDDSIRGAMHNILYCHGHMTAWTASLMEATLYFAGFKNMRACESGQSDVPELRGVEGHHLVIGTQANWIESMSWEAEPDTGGGP